MCSCGVDQGRCGRGEIIIRLLHADLLFHEVTNQDLATRKGWRRETSGTAEQINLKKEVEVPAFP